MTDVVVIDKRKTTWTDRLFAGTRVLFSGELWVGRERYCKDAACEHINEALQALAAEGKEISDESVRDLMSSFSGHYSFVFDSSSSAVCAVDRICSIPLFYGAKGARLVISNSARAVRDALGLTDKNKSAFLQFKMAGYTLRQSTLFDRLSQLQAGEAFCVNKTKGEAHVIDYYRHWPTELSAKDPDTLMEEMHAVNLDVFRDLVTSLGGRPAWVPLSGGLDSRWVLTMLLELKYDNIVTFSYGCPGHPEVARAKVLAKKLKVEWIPVTFTRKDTRPRYFSEERRKYFSFADGLCRIPVLNDFYPLQILKERRIIPDNAVIINGQTGDYLTGGHIPAALMKEDQASIRLLLELITEKHFSLWSNVKDGSALAQIENDILLSLGLPAEGSRSSREMAQHYEAWEWRERQAKFVVNGQRVYECLGFDWKLPLWDDRLMFLWRNICAEQKLGQKMHKEYLNHYNLGEVFNGYLMGPHPLKWNERALFWSLIAYARVTGKELAPLVNKYVWYLTSYSPYYYQRTYRDYLKDSQWHRNQFSYIAKDYLEDKIYDEPDACAERA